VGLDQYAQLWRDEIFWTALRNTFQYTVEMVFLTTALSLVAAFGLNQSIRGRVILRTVYLLPYLISWVVAGLLWQWMYSNHFGVCNQVLNWFGLPGLKWLHNPAMTIHCLVIAGVWHSVGYYMVIFLAGLQSIAPVYYEAARIDGAGKRAQFILITLPLLKPIIFVVLILTMIHSFKVFDQVYVMTGGGPGRASLMLVNYIFSVLVTEIRTGYAAAMALVIFLIIMGLTILQRQVFHDSDAEVAE
jgi:multiple sugar transport system permease protein